MTNLEKQLVQWSDNQSPWKQDLLRRLALGEILADADYRTYANAAVSIEVDKTAPWRSKPEDMGLFEVFNPLTEAHLTNISSEHDPVKVTRLLHVHGANDLAPGTNLEFSPDGLTIIAGKNGSGKSGLTRILKQVAASRSSEKILPNVFQPEVTPKAVVGYSLGDESQGEELTWEHDSEPIESPMKRVRIFDSHAATAQLAGSNEVAYVPPTLQILGEYTEALQEIATIIENDQVQQNLRRAQWPDLESAAGLTIFENLGKQTALDELERISELTPDELKELDGIPAKISELTTSNPATQAVKARNIATQFAGLAKNIETIQKALSVSEITLAQKLKTEVQNAKTGLEDARRGLNQDGMITGTGNESWRRMWLAAKEFKESSDHEHDFPQGISMCPLCVQTLNPEAKTRFELFSEFMANEAQKKLIAAQRLWDEKKNSLSSLTIKGLAPADTIALVGTYDETLAESIEPILTRAESLRNAIDESSQTDAASEVPDPENISESLEALAKKIREASQSEEDKATKLAEMHSSAEAVVLLTKRQQSLSLRQNIAAKKTEIGAEHDRAILISRLSQAKSACGTSGASRKNSELSKEYVTAVCDRFAEESEALGLHRVPVELVFDRSSRGVSFIKVSIKGVGSTVNGVLSEGEQRVAAIAGFFADLTESGDQSTLVFDDPVSSLDQEFRVKVAQRLLQEAESRQVLVFTHDFTFVQYLYEEKVARERKARAQGLEHSETLTYLHIARSPEGAGVPTSAEVWRHVSVRERLGRLRERQQAAAALFRGNDLIAYEKEARDIVGALRETWEVFVEQELLNNVVTRHERSVQTQRLNKILELQTSDVAAVEYGMTIESRYMTGHAAPASDASAPVDPRWLLGEIDSFATFRKEFLKRISK